MYLITYTLPSASQPLLSLVNSRIEAGDVILNLIDSGIAPSAIHVYNLIETYEFANRREGI